MDVDLLRPGMIPIAPNTKLWFEFLIDPSLLEEHLNNSHAGMKKDFFKEVEHHYSY